MRWDCIGTDLGNQYRPVGKSLQGLCGHTCKSVGRIGDSRQPFERRQPKSLPPASFVRNAHRIRAPSAFSPNSTFCTLCRILYRIFIQRYWC